MIRRNHFQLNRYNGLKEVDYRQSTNYINLRTKRRIKIPKRVKAYVKYLLPFNIEGVFPIPIVATKRSPAPDVIPEISENGAMLEWFGVPIPLVLPPAQSELLHPPCGGGDAWCSPVVVELVLLQEWAWLIFKWLLADMELFDKWCWTLECELVLPPPCK